MVESNNLEEFAKTVQDRNPYHKKARQHPKGFEPVSYTHLTLPTTPYV